MLLDSLFAMHAGLGPSNALMHGSAVLIICQIQRKPLCLHTQLLLANNACTSPYLTAADYNSLHVADAAAGISGHTDNLIS